ncbi:MAG: penicillin-binding protein 2 [Desulfobacteraceae bacterium]|nr:penicillin-binding protein 2 [Desulfobacteraceae bacterium]MBC2751849.1 penicillin-binding protein 2 [Desulfobacteraceae bacterium]
MKTLSTQKSLRLRMALIGFLFFIGLGTIIGRAVYLQVFFGPSLAEKASGQYEKTIQTNGKRGSIFDTRMREVAVSIETLSLAAYPRKIQDTRQTARTIARILNVKPQSIARKLDADRSFVWVKRQITPKEARALRDLQLKGLEFLPEHSRYYPNRTLAAQLVGFTGIDGNGLEGIEYLFDAELTGRKGIATVLKDAFGRGFEAQEDMTTNTSGNNIVLSIDGAIQHLAEKALQQAVETHKAKSGIAVVMAPQTGDILALAHAPLFNPNAFGDFNRDVRRNRAVTDAFEPGSTMKLFSAAAALESGCCTPHTIFYCENGNYRIGRNTVHDTKKHGWLSLQRIVKYSSNIGAVKIGETIGAETLHDTLQRFGFGRPTGIACPGESKGSLGANKKWSTFDVAAVSFGHGVSVSAIQLTAAVAAIANRGILMKPRVVLSVTDARGRAIRTFDPQPLGRAISAKTADAVTRMMEMVLTEGGTGVEAALDGYSACGKTGTAQKIGKDGTYAKDRYVASFAGFTPVEDPRLAILVIIDEPHGDDHYGGTVAAPVFREIAQSALSYLNVRPSERAPKMTVSNTTKGTG